MTGGGGAEVLASCTIIASTGRHLMKSDRGVATSLSTGGMASNGRTFSSSSSVPCSGQKIWSTFSLIRM